MSDSYRPASGAGLRDSYSNQYGSSGSQIINSKPSVGQDPYKSLGGLMAQDSFGTPYGGSIAGNSRESQNYDKNKHPVGSFSVEGNSQSINGNNTPYVRPSENK